MTVWKKENGVWVEENPKQSIPNDEFDRKADTVIKNTFLNQFIAPKTNDAPTDYIIRFFMPKEYNENNYKVNPNQIADIIFKLSEQFGGATTLNSKGYWQNDGLLYQDNNLVVDILIPQISAEKAILVGEYISSAIGKAFDQLGVLFIIYPVMAEFIGKEQYDEKIKQSKDSISFMDKQEE